MQPLRRLAGLWMNSTPTDLNTRIILASNQPDISNAIAALKASKPVAIPTETVYGLAANALDSLSCSRIFSVKNRPTDNPLICHISSMEMMGMLVAEVPEKVKPVLEKFWPGPLTVLLPRSEAVPDIVSAGLSTVGVRFPSHPVAQQIIELCGFPLAAPSANLSGRPSPTSAKHVFDDLQGRIEYIVDGGSSSVGLESTVLDVTSNPPMILRPGAITAAMLKPFLPDIEVYGADPSKRNLAMEERPSTPGMKYKHYAPTAPVVLVRPGLDLEHRVTKFISAHPDASIVRLCTADRPAHPNVTQFYLSRTGDLQEIARNLFSGLRDADLLSPAWILAEAVEEGSDEAALAIMNRLGKASSFTI